MEGGSTNGVYGLLAAGLCLKEGSAVPPTGLVSLAVSDSVLVLCVQVGNAVPPPLAAAIGRELGKALRLAEQQGRHPTAQQPSS